LPPPSFGVSMKLFTDDHFLIGAMHLTSGKPCQDYAISGSFGGIAYAIVSDGCSSAGLTDMGARLITHSAARAICGHWSVSGDIVSASAPQEIEIDQEIVLGGIRQTLGLLPQDMLATCAYACVGAEGGFVHVRGDGVVAFVEKDGGLMLLRYDWANNTPFYPAYLAENLLPTFISAHGGDPDAPALTETVWTKDASGKSSETSRRYSLKAGIAGAMLPISRERLEKLSFVAIFSDGVTQVENIDWRDAAVQLLSFKSVGGLFAKRRMIRFVQTSHASGKGPIDDIAYAVIRIAPDGKQKGEDSGC